jgi:hypothetical protein
VPHVWKICTEILLAEGEERSSLWQKALFFFSGKGRQLPGRRDREASTRPGGDQEDRGDI